MSGPDPVEICRDLEVAASCKTCIAADFPAAAEFCAI